MDCSLPGSSVHGISQAKILESVVPDPGIEPTSPALASGFFTTAPSGKLTYWASVVAQLVKNSSAMQETPVRFLGQEDPLEKALATHFSILAWRIPWTDEPSGLQSMGSHRVGHD